MGELIRLPVKASSLVEVTVATLIFVLFFSFSLVAYLKLTTGGHTTKRIKSQMAVDKLAIQAKSKLNLMNEEFSEEGFRIEKLVELYRDNEQLYILNIYAIDQGGDTISYHKSVIHAVR